MNETRETKIQRRVDYYAKCVERHGLTRVLWLLCGIIHDLQAEGRGAGVVDTGDDCEGVAEPTHD